MSIGNKNSNLGNFESEGSQDNEAIEPFSENDYMESVNSELLFLKQELDLIVDNTENIAFKKEIKGLLLEVNSELKKKEAELSTANIDRLRDKFESIKNEYRSESRNQLSNLESNVLKNIKNEDQIKRIADKGRKKDVETVNTFLSDLEEKLPWLSGLIKRVRS